MCEPEAAALHAILKTGAARGGLPGNGSAVTVAAWNVERAAAPDDVARHLIEANVTVALLTELDVGMARSGNRDTVAVIADATGTEAAFAVEFIELGHGNPRETTSFGRTANTVGVHGNAVFSRHPIERAVVIPLDDEGLWFLGETDPHQRRVGGRNAIAALIEIQSGPAWFVSVHLESHSSATDRAQQMARLLAHLDRISPDLPVVLAGDVNTKDLDVMTLGDTVKAVDLIAEPLFADVLRYGFTWQGANLSGATTRRREWEPADKRPMKLDWIFVRGLKPSAPRIHPATDRSGEAISDHELLTVAIEREAAA